MNGYVCVYRSMLDWEWYKNQNTKDVFMHLLLTARHSTGSWQGIKIERGQVITGRKELSAQLNISERGIRTALNHLISTGEITIKPTNKYSIVTVVKWDDYQHHTDISDQHNDQREASKRPANDQQTTSKRPQRNKVIREKGKNDNNFDAFWSAYPKKVAKGAAVKAWSKLHVDNDLLAVMIAAIEKQRNSVQWTKDDGQYIPNPATWLNQSRWEDELKSELWEPALPPDFEG